MYEARGGPLDGSTVPCRYPAGLILINKLAGQVMIYDLGREPGMRGPKRLTARGEAVELDTGLAIGTAEGDRYDVLAYDPDLMGEWE